MANDSQYRILLSKYNVAVSRCRDLEEQARTNNQHWKERETYFKKIEDAVRSLCVSILCKNKNEMVLGEDSSWYTTPVDALISRAMKYNKEYNENTTLLLTQIQNISEKRRSHIEGLEDQIKRFKTGEAFDFDIGQTLPKESSPKNVPDYLGTPKAIKTAAEAKKIELIIEEDSDIEDDTVSASIQECTNINEDAKLIQNAVPIQDSAKKAKQIETAKENAYIPHIVDLIEIEKKIRPVMWEIIEIIGREGLSKYPEIEKRAVEKNNGEKLPQMRPATLNLCSMKVLSQVILTALPLSPKVCIYTLSDIGVRLFERKYNEKPVIPEAVKVRKEHDNLDHGYAILELQKILMDTGKYKEVNVFNRSHPKVLDNGLQYVADLVCVPLQAKYVEYVEYERGNHTYSDFNNKCNKMCKFTRFLNFVVPNREIILKKLKPQIDNWIKSRSQESIKTIKIRVTTPPELQKNENMQDAWILVYDMSQGIEPVKDFSKKEEEIT
ncbi:MAG: hypothetical protein LBI03_09530 [Clostridiales bacterium]|jgi:hypothetical protein|nr:hypothetical protein [Clostridiales bacterium]